MGCSDRESEGKNGERTELREGEGIDRRRGNLDAQRRRRIRKEDGKIRGKEKQKTVSMCLNQQSFNI